MKNIEDKVIQAYKSIAKITDNVEVDLSFEISRNNGFDSLGFVNFVVELEDALNMELDKYLAQIRKANTLQDIVRIVENEK